MLTVIVYVYVTPSPAVVLVTPSLFVTARSALVAVVFVSLAALLPAVVSVTSLETLTLLVWSPVVDAGTVYVAVTVALTR